jgi:transcriptional regulator with PAS, ATPase and Fis domain
MRTLRSIEQTVRKTAEAMKEVLKIDVEIVDTDMVRIASTGQYESQLGEVMIEGFIYRHVLTTGQTVVIENPGEHALCSPCPRRGQCAEDAEMAAAITVSGQPVGVIGLVSFDPAQTKRLLENREWMLRFIEKMAELIASELSGIKPASVPSETGLNLSDLEREAILKALAEVGEQARRKDKAAELLGISRATLYRKLKEYKIV